MNYLIPCKSGSVSEEVNVLAVGKVPTVMQYEKNAV